MVMKVMMATTSAVALISAHGRATPHSRSQTARLAAERSLADDAVEHADGGDAHLHRREELCGLSSSPSAARAPLSPASAMAVSLARLLAGHGQLGHGEDAVEQRLAARSAENPCTTGQNEHMPMYLIGDLQGCDQRPAAACWQKVDFSPSRDTLYLLGDLVNRGPDSLAVLRRLSSLGDAARCLLGNHDLHLIAMSQGVRKPGRSDTSQEIMAAPDGPALLDWLRHRPLAMQANGWLMVHAGVLPQWTVTKTLALAAEVQAVLSATDWTGFIAQMYGNEPARWDEFNVLTRLRFCTPDGTMDFLVKEGAAAAPPGFYPWYDTPGRRTAGTPVAFGHWSTLSTPPRDDVFALDTGCVWGGCLTALRLDPAGAHERRSVHCPQAQRPGE
jgi:bis(5'-nucleosyl)-tetraphosphatase (symmetrical)